MGKIIRNEEDYKRAVLDLYDSIHNLTNDSDVLSVSASADYVEFLVECIKVYRICDIVADDLSSRS